MQDDPTPTYTWHIEGLKKDAFLAHFNDLLKARDVTLDDTEAMFDRLTKLWEMRIAFIDKVILLDTGTFALSLTFLASVGSHSVARAFSGPFLHTLYAAWALLFLSILLASWHTRQRMAAIESVFVMNASLKREYRTEDRARRFGRTTGFLTGTVTPDQGGDEEPLDVGAMFKSANEVLQGEYKKVMEGAREQQKSARELVAKHSGLASLLEWATILVTIAALLLLGKAAAQIAWVFFQK